MSLEQCQRETSYFDFLGWLEYIKDEEEKELEHVSKQDYYLAQIAAMVVAVNSSNPKSVKIQDFVLKMGNVKEKKKYTKEERTTIAKAAWMPYILGTKNKKIDVNSAKNNPVKEL